VAEVTVSVDARDCIRAIDEMFITQKAEAKAASVEAAENIGDKAKEALTMQWHGKGTRTPSAPGTPPAAITGELAASIVVTETDDGAMVGPTTDYAREQELGGPMQGHPMMHWFEDGVEYYSREHSLPARPYFEPSEEAAIRSGEVGRIYYEHWAAGQVEATG
jgi:phage gpG-like protein